jgi:hypothetical protein
VQEISKPGHRWELALTIVAAGCAPGAQCAASCGCRGSHSWYNGRRPSTAQPRLGKRLRELSEQHPCDGSRRIAALLRQEGWRVDRRQVQRLRWAGGSARTARTTQGRAARPINRDTDEGCTSRSRLDVELHRRHDRAWRRVADADDLG